MRPCTPNNCRNQYGCQSELGFLRLFVPRFAGLGSSHRPGHRSPQANRGMSKSPGAKVAPCVPEATARSAARWRKRRRITLPPWRSRFSPSSPGALPSGKEDGPCRRYRDGGPRDPRLEARRARADWSGGAQYPFQGGVGASRAARRPQSLSGSCRRVSFAPRILDARFSWALIISGQANVTCTPRQPVRGIVTFAFGCNGSLQRQSR